MADGPLCPRCGNPMLVGRAIGCGPKGSFDILLPPYCNDPACRRRRDEEAIADAVARGVIDP